MQNTDVIWLINPFKLAENLASTKRCVPVSQLARLAELLADSSGSIDGFVEGFRDSDGRKLLKCRLTGLVNLECQTSFDTVPYQIEKDLVFCPVLSEEAMASVPDEYEAFLFDTEELDLVTLIEDELILSLPMVINSPDSPTQFVFGQEAVDSANVEQKEKKPNPFSVLVNLKQNSEK